MTVVRQRRPSGSQQGFRTFLSGPCPPLKKASKLPQGWRWVLVGDGPMRDAACRRRFPPTACVIRVVLWGRAELDDLHGWYEAATIFVHPTLYEGSSLVTLEAMAHRRAVIASRAGGLPDKVLPEVNGWLVPPGLASARRRHRRRVDDRARLFSMGICEPRDSRAGVFVGCGRFAADWRISGTPRAPQTVVGFIRVSALRESSGQKSPRSRSDRSTG